MTTPPAFCPSCGTRRVPEARFCGGCGADLGGVAQVPASATQAQPTPALAVEPAPPAPQPAGVAIPAPPAPPSASPGRRSRASLLLASVGLVLVVGLAAGLWLLFRPSTPGGSAVLPDDSPFPSPIALSSPPASHGPAIGDPDAPMYVGGQGFSADAVRVLTVTAVSLSLEQYRSDVGKYPIDLAALFPAYAPPGPDGQPMTNPPAPAGGYRYVRSGSTYILSVVLDTGDTYTVTSPGTP